MQDDDLAVVTQQVGHSQTGQRHDNQPGAHPAAHPVAHQQGGVGVAQQTAPGQAANNQAAMPQHPDELANPEPGQEPADADAIADANRVYASGNSPANYDGLLTREAFHALQLRAQPFDGPTAGGELFADKQTYAQINEIRHALIGGDTLLLLSGEAGSGKTTLLKQLTSQGGQRLQFFSVRGSEQFTTENLFVGILDSWNITPPATLEATVNELILSLQATRERDFIVVVMIDDAGHIPAKELHLLLASAQYINNGEDPLLRIILAAESDFEAQIPDLLPAGSNMPYSSLQLEPFHPSRAGPYMEFRLNQAGHYEVFPFDDRQVAAISNDAQGVPARINSLAADTLNAIHAPMPLKTRQSSLVPNFGRLGKIALGLLGLGLILAGLLYKAPEKTDPDKYSVVESAPVIPDVKNQATDSNSESPGPTNTGPTGTGSTDTASSTGTSAGSQNSTLQSNTAETAAASTTPSTSASPTAQQQPPAGQPASEAVAGQTAGSPATPPTTPASGEQVVAANEKAAATDVKAAAKEIEAALAGSAGATNPSVAEKPPEIKQPETASVAADSAQTPKAPDGQNQSNTGSTNATSASSETTESGEQGSASAQAGTTVKPQAGADSTDAAASTESADTSSPSAPTAEAEVQAQTGKTETASADTGKNDQTEANAAVKATGDKVEGIESANWILLQNPKQYTVQMSASTDQPSVVSFLRRSGLEAPNSIFSFQRSGKTWFALVHGLYPSIKDARAAIEKMSKSARSNQPWIREVGRIQKALKSSG